MKSRLFSVLFAAVLFLGGCDGGPSDEARLRLFADLNVIAETAGIPSVPVIAGRLIHFTEEFEALPLTEARPGGARSVTLPVGTLPPKSRLKFSYFGPPPVLAAGPVDLRLDVLGENGETLQTQMFVIRRSRISDAIDFLREHWRIQYAYIDFFRHFSVDLTELAGHKVSVRLSIQAPEPEAKAVKEYEKWAGTPMPTPYAVCRPRILYRGVTPPEPHLNVLCIIVDALRADAVGAYGYKRPTTPHIDRLADQGLLVERAYAPSNYTRGSVTAMFTGRFPSTLGIPLFRWDLRGFEKSAFQRLTTSEDGMAGDFLLDSMPRYLARKGYVTAHVGSDPFIQAGTDIGVALGFGRTASFNIRRLDTETIAKQSLSFIDKNAGRPFFLAIHFNNGHGPLMPPDEFRGQFTQKIEPDPRTWPVLYDEEIAYADQKIGALTRLLRKKGVAENTLVIVCGDHGQGFEEGHPKGHAHSLYDAETRVPFIMRLPNRVPSKTRIEGPTTLLDIYPTMLALMGETIPQGLDGRNLLDHLDGKPIEDPTYIEGAGVWGEIQGDKKLIVKEGPYDRMRGRAATDGGRLLEFYDLKTDPGERTNLAGSGDAAEAAMKDDLYRHNLLLAEYRAAQVAKIEKSVDKAADLYPQRFVEAVNVMFSAGEKEKKFFGTVKSQDWIYSYLGFDLAAGDSLEKWPSKTGLTYAVTVPAGQTRRIGFTMWPPDATFALSILSDAGQPVNPEQIYAGPYTLAYPGNPAKLGGLRDLRLLATDHPPKVDADHETGAFIWYSPPATKADTTIGGQVKDALRSWGYVK